MITKRSLYKSSISTLQM